MIETPYDFRKAYTENYQREDSDSPKQSRAHLAERLIEVAGKLIDQANGHEPRPIHILSLAAGRQKLEHELSTHPDWPAIANYARIATLDIAHIEPNKLFFDAKRHIETDGSRLPFAHASFDIVNSNMALDYMPREAFSEVARVLKPTGILMANLHHPNLIEIAEIQLPKLERKIRTLCKSLEHGRQSRKYDQYRQRLRDINWELGNIKFITEIAQGRIFNSTEQIRNFIANNFWYTSLTVQEHADSDGLTRSNGWFYLEAAGLEVHR